MRENKVVAILEQHGYVCFPSRGSRGIDLICINTEDRHAPHLAIEVGGPSKAIAASFESLNEAKKPLGTVSLVVRELKRKGRCFFRWHIHPQAFYDDADVTTALKVVREL